MYSKLPNKETFLKQKSQTQSTDAPQMLWLLTLRKSTKSERLIKTQTYFQQRHI